MAQVQRYRMVFHGPNNDPESKRAVARFARKYGGKVNYTSFWIGRGHGWHSEETVGKAAYAAVVPLENAVEALEEVRKLKKVLGPLSYSHGWRQYHKV